MEVFFLHNFNAIWQLKNQFYCSKLHKYRGRVRDLLNCLIINEVLSCPKCTQLVFLSPFPFTLGSLTDPISLCSLSTVYICCNTPFTLYNLQCSLHVKFIFVFYISFPLHNLQCILHLYSLTVYSIFPFTTYSVHTACNCTVLYLLRFLSLREQGWM